MRIAVCCLFLLAFAGVIYSLDLPLQLSWDSHNELSFAPEQSEKEYNWREFYQIGIQLDTLRAGPLLADFRLQSRADFITNQVEIRDFHLACEIKSITLSAASELYGYGKLYRLNPLHRISADLDDYRNQATRFNHLGLSYKGFSLAGGGNQHNQAMLAVSWEGSLPQAKLGYRISQEGRLKDSHWNTPVSISAAQLSYLNGAARFIGEAVYSHYFAYDNTPMHGSLYALVEFRLSAAPWLAVNGSSEYAETEPFGSKVLFMEYSANFRMNKLSFSPGFSFHRVWQTEVSGLSMSTDWLFSPQQRLGVLYRCEDLQQPVHVLGLQASLNFRI
jgi:hypothetical protein